MNDGQVTLYPVEEPMSVANTDEYEQDDSFSYYGFQVVRGEFFAHVYEPSVSFSNCKVSINTACLRKMPQINYIQFLVNPETKKLVIRPCTEDAKDSFLWCLSNGDRRKPRQIICRLFFAKLFNLMKWNPDYRYKMLGKVIKSGDDFLFLFDLTATETYQRIIKEGEKTQTHRTPVFPSEWKNQFGLPVAEHNKLLKVNIFDGYTVFGIKDESKNTKEDSQCQTTIT